MLGYRISYLHGSSTTPNEAKSLGYGRIFSHQDHFAWQMHGRRCLLAIRAVEQANSSAVPATAEQQQAAAPAASTVTVYFRTQDVSVAASPGEDLIEVAQRCSVTIPTGCWQGNCGVCEVEVYKYTGNTEKDKAAGSTPAVVRACITKLPPGYSRIEVADMDDAIWGLDGFDT